MALLSQHTIRVFTPEMSCVWRAGCLKKREEEIGEEGRGGKALNLPVETCMPRKESNHSDLQEIRFLDALEVFLLVRSSPLCPLMHNSFHSNVVHIHKSASLYQILIFHLIRKKTLKYLVMHVFLTMEVKLTYSVLF